MLKCNMGIGNKSIIYVQPRGEKLLSVGEELQYQEYPYCIGHSLPNFIAAVGHAIYWLDSTNTSDWS